MKIDPCEAQRLARSASPLAPCLEKVWEDRQVGPINFFGAMFPA